MTDKADFDNAMGVIQDPPEAWKLSQLITDRLCAIREVEALPPKLYQEIAEVVAEFYGLGVVRGMEKAKSTFGRARTAIR